MRLREIFGTNLRRLRHASGLSQEELAHRAGINRNYVGLLERAANSPTLDTIERLAEELAVDPVQFFERPGGRLTQTYRHSPNLSSNFTISELQQADHCLWECFVPAIWARHYPMLGIAHCPIGDKFTLLLCARCRGAVTKQVLLQGETHVGS